MADETRTAPPRSPDATHTGPDIGATASGPTPEPADATPERVGRFAILGELARGGMGVVYRAHDPAFDREVAVKVLADRLTDRPDAVRRFTDEARVTGQLQHPGIPPAHEVGTLPDGRPFLAMKLIKGRTLDELLRERADPSAERGKFVASFEAVCHAVAYAHSRGVIHRDLKPHNVMVGAFAEVQVMDWGLAKFLASGRVHPGRLDEPASGITEIRTTRDSDGEKTQAGSVLGTPAFMPPEQAGGEVEKIDRRADVFGLGAVLCVVLTGMPPYVGPDAEAVRLMAIRGQLADALARLDGCGAEPELVALARRCLSADRADRPADAGAVADAVQAFRAEAEARARRAEVERAAAEARAVEQRKRRRAELAFAAVVVLLVAVAAAAAWGYQRERGRREAAAAQEAEAALQTAQGLNDAGWRQSRNPKQWRETVERAFREVDRAEQLTADRGPADDLRGRVARMRRLTEESDADCRFGQGIEDHLGEVLERNGTLESYGVAAARLLDLLRARGFDTTPAGRARMAEWAKKHHLKVSLQVLLMFVSFWHPDAATKAEVAEVSRAVDDGKTGKPREWIAALGRAVGGTVFGARDQDTLTRLSADPDVTELAPTALALVGLALRTLGDREIAVLRLTEWQARDPHNFWLTVQLAVALQQQPPPRRQEALRLATAAVGIRPDSPRAHATLAWANYANGNAAAAEAACRKALEFDAAYPLAQQLLARLRAGRPPHDQRSP